MQWLSNIMNWGQSSIQSQDAGQAGYGLGQPLVTGEVGNAQYAQGSQGQDWSGLLGSAAKGYLSAQANRPQTTQAESQAMSFGGGFKNPGAAALSGLLISNQNRSQM